MGLPLSWVSSPSASSVGALLSWAPAVFGLFHAEVVSARLYLSHGTIDVTRVYVPWFFVSSQQRIGVTDIKALDASQLSGLGQTVLSSYKSRGCGDLAVNIGSTNEKPFTNMISNQSFNYSKESVFRQFRTSPASHSWEALNNHMWPEKPIQAG